MEEHLPGQAGSANTPPFPRRSQESVTPPAPSTESRDDVDQSSMPLGAAGGGEQEPEPALSSSQSTHGASSRSSEAADGGDDDSDWFEEEDGDLNAGEDDEDPKRASIGRDARHAASFAARASARLVLRTEEALGRGAANLAERLTDTAARLELLAEEQLHGTGSRARAGEAAHSAARWMDDLAVYLRDRDAQALREDVERQVRNRPLQMILVTMAVGWVTGRVMR